ncbi:MAG: putative sulfate exporter family transporter [Pirellulaceae bacterium]|nr:putative sulfate exporter family transporter [Pirellulaceae bacterium]
MRWTEDWAATTTGLLTLAILLILTYAARPLDVDWQAAKQRSDQLRFEQTKLTFEEESKLSEADRRALAKQRNRSTLESLGIHWSSATSDWLAKLESWTDWPTESFRKRGKDGKPEGIIQWQPLLGTFAILTAIGCAAMWLRGLSITQFLCGFPGLFALAVAAYLLAAQSVVKYYNFEYPLWGLLIGMLICNTLGTPGWFRPALHGELFIKIGLVLLGAEVLVSRLLALGAPGVLVAWVVTPVVLTATYIFGQRVLKLESRSLNLVISADMSVCGVSAAIATAAACKAKQEELSLAIGLSLCFTAVMMIVMPLAVGWLGLDPVVGGAWIGGTLDSTGAVVAAGEVLGIRGSETAVTVKMIQNIMIGVIALAIAVYWARWVEPQQIRESTENHTSTRSVGDRQVQVSSLAAATNAIGWMELWRRFPKFVLGFLIASIGCSLIFWHSLFGESWIQVATGKSTSLLRGWIFCVAFVAIGLSTDFRQLAPYLRNGKPVVLYVCGQCLNLLLTLIMAYWMFGVVFKQ